MPTKKVNNPEIAKVDCPSCGAVNSLRINRNGCVYFYCNQILDGGERCFYRVTYGKKKSREIIETYSGDPNPDQENNTIESQKNGVKNGIGLQENQNIVTATGGGASSNGEQSESGGFFSRIAAALAD